MMTAANAINSLGLDLLTKMPAQTNNTLLSPYSIQMGFGMLLGGAAGATCDEMTRVLHYPKTETELHRSFAALREALERIAKESAEEVERKRKFGGAGEPITLTMANRLFGQKGYEFRSEFLALTRELYNAPFEALDFCRNSVDAVRHINT